MSAFPEGFNPAIDRYDRRSATRLFHWLWPAPERIGPGNVAVFQVDSRVAYSEWKSPMFAPRHRPIGNFAHAQTITRGPQEVVWWMIR